MDLFIVLALIAFVGWLLHISYKAGQKDAEAKYKREMAEKNTPDWSTFSGEISGLRDFCPMPGTYTLDVVGQPSAFTSVALKHALAEIFADGIGLGRKIVYTVSEGGVLQGFTPIEEWTGPAIPQDGLHEKGFTALQPKHKNQFIEEFLREQVEGTPGYENVRFY